MTATATPLPATSTAGPSLRSRIYGLGSIFAKTLRDSRRAILLAALLLGGIFMGVTGAISSQFSTAASRLEIEQLIKSLPPILQGLGGPVVNVGTMGGYLQHKYGTFFPVVLSLWSIVALSGTLAAEARRGSLEFVSAAPRSRVRIAIEKLSGHLTGLGIAFLVSFVAIAIAGAAYAVLPGDAISVTSAFGYAIWMVLMALAAGGVAWALAPFIGRGGAAGIAGFITIAGFVVTGYSAPVPELATVAKLTWFGWTVNHLPLAGQFEWPAVALLALFDVAVLAIGVVAFRRRDIGVTSTLPSLSMPRSLVGLSGPFARAVGNNLAAAIAWGAGIGFFGLVMASAAKSFVASLGSSPQFTRLLNAISPGTDFATVGGFLQLLFIQLGIIMVGLAAATLVAGWASEETSGRLEFLLAAPLSRVRWVLASAAGLLVDIFVVVALVGLGIGIGGATTGGDLLTPIIGSMVLVFYGGVLVGVGMAVGGLIGTRFAAPVTVLAVFLTWFLQLFGSLFDLPDFVQQLAITNHYGKPLVGVWDFGGIAASVVIAALGIVLAAWGFQRRDLRG
jgi:ABC-2 type transport system permease protein